MDFANDSESPAAFDYAAAAQRPAAKTAGQTKGKGHWERVKQEPLPGVPSLPDNPTEEEKAAHQAAVHAKVQTRIDNISFEWIPDPEPTGHESETERPPMHPLPAPSEVMNMNRHESHCSVCQHPQRDFIEEEFIHWCSPRATADDFDIDVRALYRHARAFNLIGIRNRKVRGVLNHILERAEHVATPSADAIIRAVHAFTRVNDDGRWIEPPSHVVVSSGSRAAAPSPSTGDPSGAINISSSPAALNQKRQHSRVKSISSRLPRKKSPK